MKQGDMEVLVKAFAPVIREMVIRAVQPVVDRLCYLEMREMPQGEPGTPGRDGLGFDDLDVCVLDDDRTIEFAFRRGEDEKVFTLKWPTVIDRGVFKEGQKYDTGDGVTWGGQYYIATEPTDEESPKPDFSKNGKPWRLAVRKGQNGKDAKVG
jgi:collagen type III alpha